MKIHFRFFFLLLFFPCIVFGGSQFSQSSVLANGTWYKFKVRNSGLHRIGYHDLEKMGISPSQVNTANIRIFGNGSGMVPEQNGAVRHNDLREISIQIHDGGDGKFDTLDFIQFYGEGPDAWKYASTTHYYSHSKNLYSDVTYYYMTLDQGPGLRVKMIPRNDTVATYFSSRFDDMVYHELDQVSVIKSGKRWFGEKFTKSANHYDFDFSFPYIDSISPIRMKVSVIARSDKTSKFNLLRDGAKIDSLVVQPVTLDYPGDFALGVEKVKTLFSPSAKIRISLDYIASSDASTGWLDFIEMQLSRNLYWLGPQFTFRDINSKGPNKVTEFTMKKAKAGITIWNITNMSNISQLTPVLAGSNLTFRARTDSLCTFLAFDGTHFDTVSFAGTVANQNLHALQPKEMIIVAPPFLFTEARRLADFHLNHNQIEALVVSVPEIFNEFSCGQPDPGGIRDFIKMLYDRASGSTMPKYVLLFGDGSYDAKDRVPGNNNLVPTLESQESLNTTVSFVTDDFFGIMGDFEGSDATGSLEIGVGRFPVSTLEQARTVVDKIIHYSGNTDTICSDWRNNIALVCDEGERNYFVGNSEDLDKIVAAKYPVLNVNKIYFDAYPMVKIPAGARFPEANKALNSAVEKGTLLINYIGHGGETGWSNRQVLTMADVNSWTNSEKLPVFVTATCEFSRFDNPERFSAGEEIIVRPGGGGIAMFSTTRTTFAGPNQSLDTSFFRHMMDRKDGRYIKMGELIKISKNNNQNNSYLRNFVLLGDPAQQMAFPEDDIVTTSINELPENQSDTALGLSKVHVKGRIQDFQGSALNTFNGTLTAKIFDKPTIYSTLGNTFGQQNGSYPQKFILQDHLMSKIKVAVVNGEFNLSFLVPKSVGLSFGKGKISYYAENGVADAKGYTDKVIFGGRDQTILPETVGPNISLFLENRNFISGSRTGSDPLLIADLYDTSGINSVGFGIGHDIVGAIDDDWAHVISLNDYFEPVLGSYTRGSLSYQLSGIQPGQHKFTLKAFDQYDNSAEQDIYFWVLSETSMTIQNVFCYPNPAKSITHFSFTPVKTEGSYTVSIDIYNLSGIKLKTLSAVYSESGLSPLQIDWDLTDAGGNKLLSGIYPFTVKFAGINGAFMNTSGKIAIIN